MLLQVLPVRELAPERRDAETCGQWAHGPSPTDPPAASHAPTRPLTRPRLANLTVCWVTLDMAPEGEKGRSRGGRPANLWTSHTRTGRVQGWRPPTPGCAQVSARALRTPKANNLISALVPPPSPAPQPLPAGSHSLSPLLNQVTPVLQ